jgi:ABC-2 type transport system permease protein
MRLVLAQIRMELTTLVRNYEQLLLIMVIPIGVLVFFGNVAVLPDSITLTRLVASVLTLSLISTAMVSTGIATAFERSYHVLKRLGVTPLGRSRLIWAKAGSVSVVELVQVTVLVAIAVGLGWSIVDLSWWRLALALLLGTAAFAGIGLCLAGRLRAEANLAAQNGLYLVLLALGGVIIPVDDLPDGLGAVARYLPSGALAEVVHASLGGAPSGVWLFIDAPLGAWLVLAIWALVAPLAAARLFRFDG